MGKLRYNPVNAFLPSLFHYKVTQPFVWRHAFKCRIWEASLNKDEEIGHYYEFGVYQMSTAVLFHRMRRLMSLRYKFLRDIRMFCFDSFEGLPEATSGDFKEDSLWIEGAFTESLESAKNVAKKNKIKNIEFIAGYYSDSLTQNLKERLQKFPPGFIHIDCDLYSSTRDVLNWLDGYALPGAIFYFDDIWDYYAHPEAGEMRAINEYNDNKSNKGMLIEHPLSLGSKTVYTYVPRDPADIAKQRKNIHDITPGKLTNKK